jgi:hypothetical protein
MTDPPSTELGMANEDAIARAPKTPTLKKWSTLSNNSVLQYGSMHFKKVVDDAERLKEENKLIAHICHANKNSKKQALQKKQSQEDNKNNLKDTRCSPNDSPEMVAAKLSRTYSKCLLTKEGGELVYNGQKIVKKINTYGAVEKSMLSKIVKNQRKGRYQ